MWNHYGYLSTTNLFGHRLRGIHGVMIYEGWNFNSDNYLFTTDTK